MGHNRDRAIGEERRSIKHRDHQDKSPARSECSLAMNGETEADLRCSEGMSNSDIL